MFARAVKRPSVPYRDWYWDASAEDRREYDAFGPWIDPVRSAAEMPPAFRPAYAAHRDARFLLKVPIAADRRSVRPGMNLYRMVLAVHDDHLSVVQLAEGGMVTRTVAWRDVAAVRSTINLLSARLSLLLKDGEEIAVDYNAVSSRRMDEVADFVRDRVTARTARAGEAPEGASVAVADPFFENMLFAIRADTAQPVVPIHFEPRDRPCRDGRNRYRLTTGLLILDATDELIVVDREVPFRRVFHPTYVARTTFIPYAALSSFGLAPPPGRARFHALTLTIDQLAIVEPCLACPDRVAAVLAAHGVPQTAD